MLLLRCDAVYANEQRNDTAASVEAIRTFNPRIPDEILIVSVYRHAYKCSSRRTSPLLPGDAAFYSVTAKDKSTRDCRASYFMRATNVFYDPTGSLRRRLIFESIDWLVGWCLTELSAKTGNISSHGLSKYVI